MPVANEPPGTDRATRSAVPQDELLRVVLPLIRSANQRYEKYQQIEARPAVTGETVITNTADGKETTNSAEAGAMVVRNLTAVRECYIVPGDKFSARYELIDAVDEGWSRYKPLGEILAIEISKSLAERLEVGAEFQVMAPWGSPQRARLKDMFVSPLPDLAEVYRISHQEFEETYRPAS